MNLTACPLLAELHQHIEDASIANIPSKIERLQIHHYNEWWCGVSA